MAVVDEEVAERRRSERASRPRRSWLPRPLPALAAACVLLVVGLGAGLVLRGGDGATYVPEDVPAGVQASLRVEDDKGMLELHGMEAPPEGRVMQVWLMHDADGPPEPTDALFTPNRNGDASVAVPAMEGVTRVLVSEEPRGGSEKPTTTPSLDFQIEPA
jgi:hypothetical protein